LLVDIASFLVLETKTKDHWTAPGGRINIEVTLIQLVTDGIHFAIVRATTPATAEQGRWCSAIRSKIW
jgi:hypothetical protein